MLSSSFSVSSKLGSSRADVESIFGFVGARGSVDFRGREVVLRGRAVDAAVLGGRGAGTGCCVSSSSFKSNDSFWMLLGIVDFGSLAVSFFLHLASSYPILLEGAMVTRFSICRVSCDEDVSSPKSPRSLMIRRMCVVRREEGRGYDGEVEQIQIGDPIQARPDEWTV